MFVNIFSAMMAFYPISEWEVPFQWEWLVSNSPKTIISFAYFWEILIILAQQLQSYKKLCQGVVGPRGWVDMGVQGVVWWGFVWYEIDCMT